MEVRLLAEVANAGAGVALVFTVLWVVTRCKIRVDCDGRSLDED